MHYIENHFGAIQPSSLNRAGLQLYSFMGVEGEELRRRRNFWNRELYKHCVCNYILIEYWLLLFTISFQFLDDFIS